MEPVVLSDPVAAVAERNQVPACVVHGRVRALSRIDCMVNMKFGPMDFGVLFLGQSTIGALATVAIADVLALALVPPWTVV